MSRFWSYCLIIFTAFKISQVSEAYITLLPQMVIKLELPPTILSYISQQSSTVIDLYFTHAVNIVCIYY